MPTHQLREQERLDIAKRHAELSAQKVSNVNIAKRLSISVQLLYKVLRHVKDKSSKPT